MHVTGYLGGILAFDIHLLDKFDAYSAEGEQALSEYQDTMSEGLPDDLLKPPNRKKQDKAKEKHKRKAAKAARKRSRRKKRK